jgi:Protein of unknown function (DUF3455)
MIRRLICGAAALLAGCGAAHAEEPLVPAPKGAPMLLEALADGVQIYVCEAKGSGYEWVFKSPEANLFDRNGRQIGQHYAGPTWMTADRSSVVAEVAARADSPKPGAIPWLLLRATTHVGTGPLASAAFIRRTETVGGVAPKGGCDAAHNGEQARMRYSALYEFLGAAN